MTKKVMFLFIAGFLISIIQSCCTDYYTHKWSGFEIQTIDNSGEEPVICDVNRIISKDALGFRISMNDTVFYGIAQNFKNFSLIADCKATSCGTEWSRPHNITSIIIKTIFDYSEEFPAGTDITSLFKARIVEGLSQNYNTIDDIIPHINSLKNSNGYSILSPIFDLYLMDNTCIGGQQKFEISILLSDEKIFTKQTEDLNLK